jgi:hypothetical protein
MAEVQMANLPSGGVGLTAQGTPAVGTQPSLPVARDRALPAAAGRATPPQLPDGQGLHQASSSSAACAHRRRARLWGLASLTSAACPSSASARLPQAAPPPAPLRVAVQLQGQPCALVDRVAARACCLAATTLDRRSCAIGWMSRSPPAAARARGGAAGYAQHTPSVHKKCNYRICASQVCISLTKSKVNSIYTYNFK